MMLTNCLLPSACTMQCVFSQPEGPPLYSSRNPVLVPT